MDNHYPTVDLDFIISLAKNCTKIKGIVTEGGSTGYIVSGAKPIAERIIIIRNINGQVDLDFSMSIAIRLKCIPELMDWLEVNRNWKDGAFFVPAKK